MKVVLFDLDGTLVKAGGAGRHALNRAIESLYAVRDICSTFSLTGRMDRQNFHLAFLHATGRKPRPIDLQRVERAYLRFLPTEVLRSVRAHRYELIPGISNLLRHLSRKPEVLLGLGTGNVEQGAVIKLKPSGLLRYFRFGGFGTDGRSRTQMLRWAVRSAEQIAGQKIPRRHVHVIGDTPRDVLAGRKGGYRTGVVTNGFGDAQELQKAKPDILAPNFRNLQTWLDWILRP